MFSTIQSHAGRRHSANDILFFVGWLLLIPFTILALFYNIGWIHPDPLAASLPVSFCHRSSLSGMRRDACLCLPFKRRPDSFVLVSSGRPVLLSSLCHFYGDADDGTDSPQENKFAVSRSFFPVKICLFGGNPHFGAMDRQNNSGPPMRAAIFVINRLYTMKCRRGKTAASTALLRFHCLDQCY